MTIPASLIQITKDQKKANNIFSSNNICYADFEDNNDNNKDGNFISASTPTFLIATLIMPLLEEITRIIQCAYRVLLAIQMKSYYGF